MKKEDYSSSDVVLPHLNRRKILGILATASLVPLIGCDPNPMSSSENPPTDGGSEGTISDASPTDSTPEQAADSTPTGSWASGGTKAMTSKSQYPNPFAAAATACMLVATTTEGPCTTTTDIDRQDISEGLSGLPVRLALKVVNSSCEPLAGVAVKIWHTNAEGSYSGQTPNNNMCLKQQSYTSVNFFRGVQTTGQDGIAYFDTCFPGWYKGRAVHIHFQIKNGNTSTRLSQLFFPEELTKEIFTNHQEYSSYGQPDTVFATDGIIKQLPAAEIDRHILTVAKMPDGALLASKVVTVS